MLEVLKTVKLSSTIVFDIETAPQYSNFSYLPKILQKEFIKKYKDKRTKSDWTDEQANKAYFQKAGLYSEWGKVVCISVVGWTEGSGEMYVESYSGEEKEILTKFNKLVPHYKYISGHNVLGFDIPFIARRMILNQITPHKYLNIFGQKEWNLKHVLDTMSLWGATSYSYKTSLNLLALSLNLPTPKDDIDGSDVGRVYWEEKNGLERIVKYCEKDTTTTAKVLAKFRGVKI